jgi:hypothetical protein
MTTTERGHFKFTVKEYASGEIFISLEPLGERLPSLGRGQLGFDLPVGTSMEKAEDIARYLNTNLANVTFTPLGA